MGVIMAGRKTKNSEEEKLTPENLDKVIQLLEAEKPITKKEACSILNIAYNTTRLGTLIEKHKEKKVRDQLRRREKRGKPATPDEVKYVVESYLEGLAIDNICSAIYRSAGFVNSILETYAVPIRSKSYDYFKPQMIPDGAVKEKFSQGEVVYSTRYDSVCRIEDEVPHYQERVYRVWLMGERWKQYAYQPASELASLEHLMKLGVNFGTV
jgi:hypothetical protein